jgi:PAS domain S-box-containing protein
MISFLFSIESREMNTLTFQSFFLFKLPASQPLPATARIIFMTKDLLNRTQDYLDIAGVMIVVIKPDQTIELINKKGCEVLGYEKGEIEGLNWFDQFVPAEDREEARSNFTQMLQSDYEPVNYYANTVLTKEGDIRFIQWHNAYLRDEAGLIIAILSSGEDVTFKKILQSRISSLQAEKRKQILAAILEAQENERYEIAYELHDNVSQILTTCKILLESEINSKEASPVVTNTYKYLQNAINEIRNLSHRLNPAQLEEIGLEDSIRHLVQRLAIARKFDVQFEVNDPKALKKLDYHISLSLFRIVQEQMNNILKHADAGFVRISINILGKFVDIEIMDNGKGFDPKTTAKGLGLKNIRNRAEYHQGRSYISAAPGEGCSLSVCIPIQD